MISTKSLLDPEILPALEAFPDVSLEKEGLPLIRQVAAQMVQLADADAQGVVREEVHIPALDPDDPDVRCLVYRPKRSAAKSGAYLHLHGGGYILGSAEGSDQHNVLLAGQLGIVIVSVDYRLAPEHPVPAGLNDSYSALAWMHQNADELGIDTDRIAVGGESAGGGLAAALAIHARDKGEYSICFQLLTYPMLDDRTGSESQPGDPLTGEFVWTRERNQLAWSYYLGASEPQAPYVPARIESVEGLPPTWLSTAALDLFRDENIDYAQRLLKAGIATELIVYPGTCHGFQWASEASVTKQYLRDHAEALSRALCASA
ncbi:MAG: alpha/beta hydrolase [Pseudomonadota bacterium]